LYLCGVNNQTLHVLNTFIAILIVLVFSAFFSGMEIAFVSSNKLRFELDKKQKSFTSSILTVFYHNPQQYISTMLVGNNICLVIYGLLMANILTPHLQFLSNQFLITLSQTVIATIIVLITGEFIPKTIFRANPYLWLKIFSLLILFFYVVLYPISKFATWVSVLVMRIFGIKITKEQETVYSRVDLNYLLQESFDTSETHKTIENEVKIFQNALDFSNVKLRDCYVPRTEIVALDIDSTSVETLKQTFIQTGFSKIPVYKDNIDNIIGYIHSSEMFNHQNEWQEHLYQIPIVPENMAAHKLMKIFLQEKKSIAVVVDEFGGTAGIVTLEDIMEEIFGEIEDEHDVREYISEKTGENEYLVSGRLKIEDINNELNLRIPESDEYETIAGFILFHSQRFPKLNETLRIGDYAMKCVKIANNRIDLVKITVNPA
jgi:CBS domain containing-hemolysin-like protein